VFRDLWAFFWSRRLATLLLVFLILLAIIGATIPQESIYPAAEFAQWQQNNRLLAQLASKFKLTRLFDTPLFIGCSLLLCLSLFACSVRRVFLLLTGREAKEQVAAVDHSPHVRLSLSSSLPADQAFREVIRLLRKQRFCCKDEDARTCYAVRGRGGAFGSTLFHFSFLLLLIGALLSTWGRFEGFFTLTEGQSFRGLPGEFTFTRQAPLLPRTTLPFQLNFEELLLVNEPEPHHRSGVSLQEEDGTTKKAWIRPFHALTYRGYTFYQVENGFSPAFVLRNAQGQVLYNAFVALQTKRLGESVIFRDYFYIPGTRFMLRATFYPDGKHPAENLTNRPGVADNPTLDVELMNRDDSVVFTGTVAQGKTIDAGDVLIEFADLRHWSRFRVVKDLGLPLIYGSFFAGIVGYFLRLFSVRETLKVTASSNGDKSGITLAGHTEQNVALFTEKFTRLASLLRKGVSQT